MLEDGMLEGGFEVYKRFIAGDNAYACTDYLLTPYPGKFGDDDWKDDFN
jgi:hypothetical protein